MVQSWVCAWHMTTSYMVRDSVAVCLPWAGCVMYATACAVVLPWCMVSADETHASHDAIRLPCGLVNC
eukprot:10313588-Heterocapsa_arctica.AAC.1